MNRYHPRSPGARLQALRSALWEEDRAREVLTVFRIGFDGRGRLQPPDYSPAVATQEAETAFDAARDRRMEAEREFWETRAGHGLD